MGPGCVCRAGYIRPALCRGTRGEMSFPRGSHSEVDQNHSQGNNGVRAERHEMLPAPCSRGHGVVCNGTVASSPSLQVPAVLPA